MYKTIKSIYTSRLSKIVKRIGVLDDFLWRKFCSTEHTRSLNGDSVSYTIQSKKELMRWNSLMKEEDVLVDFIDSIEEGDVIFDIGANIGTYSCFALSNVGATGRVIAFEPEPQNAEALRENLALNGDKRQWDVIEVAASDYDGLGKMKLSTEVQGAGNHALSTSGDFEVEVRRLDNMVSEGEVPSPDAMKIDVEGAELEVLAGCPELIGSVRCVYCEVHERNSENYKEVVRYFKQNGLEVDIVYRRPDDWNDCHIKAHK